MNKQVAKALKKRHVKLLPVDKELETTIKELSELMGTNAVDVVATAIDILKVCVGRTLIIRKPNAKKELELKSLENFKPLVNFEDED